MGKTISVMSKEIARLEMIVTGIGFINSPMSPLKPKYNGTKIAIVVDVPKMIGLA